MLQRGVHEFDMVCERRKLKVNVGISRAMALEMVRNQTIDIAKLNRVKTDSMKECKIWLGEENMWEASEFKYLEMVICKNGKMEGMKERAVKGRQAMGTQKSIMKEEG